jgi:EAL domain-containing protein (putative c-di-GMP-specific phosphodiesterase class I)
MLDNEEDAAIVHSTIDLAHDLGLKVIAEGVETAALSARLAELRCDLVQGFHFGRAMSAQDVITACRNSSLGKR